MKFRVFTEPQQGATYETQLELALESERLGFDAFFRSDHLLRMGQHDGYPGPTDTWVTLAGLARETSTIRLGALVTSATFRHPGLLAVQVAQVDAMSGGRIEFGLGTGWFAAEHAAYGIPFPERRFGMLEEQLEVVTGLWETPVGGRFSFEGDHYTLVDSPALPKPAQSPMPVIVGGKGPQRTPALAARFASEFNIPFPEYEGQVADLFLSVDAACEAAGRDPRSLGRSVAYTTVIAATEAAYRARCERLGRDPEELRANGLAGTIGEVAERVSQLAVAGADTLYLQMADLADVETLELAAAELLPAFDA
ncbi:LLM class F420-dependent oxidoreductase [Agromyces seonyuensis]|uniref:TIGR03560 family F420-dependent LLM class oxidoreductase n=1 Tax=Agromyces seonyuensis TaxID=2662446 RepID=A0A6I4P029_9MICO|nr:LLM class F420-dependent oxidoreductase [Agromyces seonyuensis]MWB98095.1 TIGR03560 family F420-dependent LLM class oxidoreductase [Agromyces seonyuensis]